MTDSDDSTIGVVRKTTRELARKFDYEYWRAKDKLGEYPWEFVKAFAEGGWLGAMIPEEYGGLGLGMTESGVMMHEIAASGAGTSGALGHALLLFPPAPIIRHGSEEMKQEFLPKIAAGEILMAFGVTEPTAGVDTSRITTKADKIDGGWVVNGQKVWITNAQNAHKILLLARTSPRRRGQAAGRDDAVLHRPGPRRITVREIEKLGRSAVDSNELFIDNLEVPDEDVVGEVGRGFYYLLDGLNSGAHRGRHGGGRVRPGRLGHRRPSTPTTGWSSTVRSARTRRSRIRSRTPGSASGGRADGDERRRAVRQPAQCGPEATAAKFLGAEAGFEACDRAMSDPGRLRLRQGVPRGAVLAGGPTACNAPFSQEMVLNYISAQALKMPRSY